MGASAAFGDLTASARITQNETGIQRLEEKVRKIQKLIPKEVTYANIEKQSVRSHNGGKDESG